MDADTQAAIAKLGSKVWRLCNLYRIRDKDGRDVPFVPNWAQRDFFNNLHYRNITLKARKLGFTTLIDIYGADEAKNHPATGEPLSPRMHLNREQVAALIAHLQSWLDSDTFEVAPNDRTHAEARSADSVQADVGKGAS